MAYKESDQKLKIPALGRDFQIGTLYDARRDKIILGKMIRVIYIHSPKVFLNF